MSLPQERFQKADFKSQDFEGIFTDFGDSVSNPQRDLHGEPQEELTVEQAAKTLGISTKAVIKRLQRKSLPGRKIEIKGVEQWRVLPGDWTQDTQRKPGQTTDIPWGDPVQPPLSRDEFTEAIRDLKESLHGSLQAPQIVFDRSEEIESIQKQLINAQNMIIALQHDNKEQALSIVRLEGDLRLLPDLEKAASQVDSLEKEIKEKDTRINELELTIAERKQGWFDSFCNWFKSKDDNPGKI